METNEEEEDFVDPNWVCCLLEEIPSNYTDFPSMHSATALHWSTPLLDSCPGSTSLSSGTQNSCGGLDDRDESSNKRVRVGSSAASCSKASREKMRRDRVNERFLELFAVLEPGSTPKLDKAAILSDAIHMVSLLHEETSRLKGQNVDLKQKINELKAEKNELRAEKQRLKAEKDEMEQKLKASLIAHHPSFPATARPPSYAVPCQTIGGKLMAVVNYPGVPMWQFVPQTAVDTSQDHVLRPPVA